MSRIQQDQFVDDEEDECCPLCVEEFDLSDKNFRPCPCGYQICQFCYNNIKTTMNGLCPACRRPYDDSTIEFKNITPEELAKHKQQIAQKAKKNAALRQKEAQKAEADTLSRKHLAGLRVVQKNLVYVTGLNPTSQEKTLLEALRGPEYFGQYGQIIKIVVSKAKENAQHQQSVGVYVTFARKEDAAVCIQAVDGTQNGGRTLRAQYGTTKYCSAYLRGEQCNNRNCMFLHEPGEENDSFTRQDLSLMNVISTQQPAQSHAPHSASHPPQPQPPPQRGPAVAAAAPMNRQDSNDAPSSPAPSSGDGPALPATANWGSKVNQERRASRSTTASNSSPMTSNAVPIQLKPSKVEEPTKKKGKEKEKPAHTSKSMTPQPVFVPHPQKPRIPGFDGLLNEISNPNFKFVFAATAFSAEELESITNFPQLLDPNGGAKRRAVKEKEKEKELELQRQAETQAASQAEPAPQQDENAETTAGGSLQLGGEPEERHESSIGHGNQHAIAPPGQQTLGGGLFGQNTSLAEDFGSLGISRGLTAQQQQQLLLFKSAAPQSAGLLSTFQTNQTQQPNHGQSGNAPGHGRHASRFSFANDSTSAASVQPVANQKLMNQQSSMMPKNTNHFNQLSQHQPLGSQFYTSGVQGPPPGLKATGTPPVGGNNMFGQGHGFATGGLGYGVNAAGRNSNDAMYQELFRNRGMDSGARVADVGKHDQDFTPEDEASMNVDALVNDTDADIPIGPLLVGSHVLEHPRRATPTIPPGFSVPATPKGLPDQPLRPLSGNASSGVTPAIPVIPAMPIRPATPKSKKDKQPVSVAENESPSVVGVLVDSNKTDSRLKSSRKVNTAKSTTEGSQKKGDELAPAGQKENKLPSSTVSIEKSPAKSAPKSKATGKKGQVTAILDSSPHKDAKDVTVASSTSTKRQHPGKLDIAAATKVPENEPSPAASSFKTGTPPKNPRAISLASAGSMPPSPAATSTGSPVKRSTALRTLRVLPTPKTENPPPLSATSASSLPQVPTVDKLRSRQASIASLNQPGTPASELISDNASITSTSVSRANSPPPLGGKVGTAPVRKKTKSQAKKERQERARQIAEEQAVAMDEHIKSDPEPVQAPIIGRKKKTKKLSVSNPKMTPAPVKSRPASPKPAIVEEEGAAARPATSRKGQSGKASASLPHKSQQSPVPESPIALEPLKEKPQPTAQSIIADLQKTGELLASTLEFFKPLSSSLAHATRTSQSGNAAAPPDLKIQFSEADLDALAKKKPVRLGGKDGKSDSRTLITPQGKFFWGLTPELEEKALELEKQIEELKGTARFHPRKQAPPHMHTHTSASHAQSKDVLPAIATALKEAGAKLSKSSSSSSSQAIPKLDHTSTFLGSTSLPLPPVQPTSSPNSGLPFPDLTKSLNKSLDLPNLPPVSAPQPQSQPQTPADALAYLNHFVLPKTDNPLPNTPRTEMAAVGGPPGLGSGNVGVNVNKIAKAAKVVAEGGALGSELEGIGVMATDLLGGIVVQGLEALVGAGLGFGGTQDFSVDNQGNLTMSGSGVDVQGLVNAFEAGAGLGGLGAAVGRRGRGSVLGVDEAEQAMLAAKKDTEALEKKLAGLIKRNKRMVSGAGGKA
ncbi:hypothetical protein K469DRAFT_712144 [Zopfia rhizophila CBS 207.26]|uniref:RING-type domain-containing protein n=1 Tax=Zopfia rhizophila CBS 207.26 TaxID=1314779 RepID=A0A6A6ETI1_9PEZI|nr:hypothetical protein K469DRAFT_712144 [Zopfia rhizophila CBS 207.26]